VDEDTQILERLVKLETDMVWMKKSLSDIRKDVNRSRWELLGGIVFVIAMQIIIRLLLG
jgi:hypothetical protein